MIGDMTDKIDMISVFFYVFSILNPRFTAITQMTLLVSALSFFKRSYIVTVVL